MTNISEFWHESSKTLCNESLIFGWFLWFIGTQLHYFSIFENLKLVKQSRFVITNRYETIEKFYQHHCNLCFVRKGFDTDVSVKFKALVRSRKLRSRSRSSSNLRSRSRSPFEKRSPIAIAIVASRSPIF